MSSQNPDEVREAMALWRDLIERHVTPEEPPASESELLARLRSARDRVAGARRPPRPGLPHLLAQVAQAWQPEWTDQLQGHPDWPTVRPRLSDARRLVSEGRLVDAGFELESILGDCCQEARRLLGASEVRRLDESRVRVPDAELRVGLARLIRWLETL